jgi:HEAT repeat protein
VPVALQVLEKGDQDERVLAARALSALGSKALPAVDGLKRAANDPDEKVREAAKEALRSVEGR